MSAEASKMYADSVADAHDISTIRARFSNRCVQELFEEQVAKSPNDVALILGDQRISYQQLNERSNRLAHYLRRKGAGPEVLVGIYMTRSLGAIVCILGILKAGAAYVPLDTAYPPQRLEEIIDDSKLSLVLADRSFPVKQVSLILPEEEAERIDIESGENPVRNTAPDNAAYVLYTSGSTGKPKGVVGLHRGIANNRTWMEFDPHEVCCLSSSLTFAASITGLFLPLVSGVPLVVLSERELQNLDQMLAAIEHHKITRIVFVASILKKILDLGAPFASRLRSLRTVGAAGSELTASMIRAFAELVPHAQLHNGYSSTEIGALATVCDIDPDAIAKTGISIGRPVWNTSVHILDEQMKPVATGEIGELYVGSPHLARGYLFSPDLTRERFIPDPFIPNTDRRLFRTGDLARMRPDGMLELAGRVDDQVKIRGFRVALSEVETHLARHPAIREAAVAVRRVGEEERLVAYVTPWPGRKLSVSELRERLAGSLPQFMIPSAFTFLRALPVLGNGKLDRAALPPPDTSRPLLDTPYEEPKSPIEHAMAAIWMRLFGIRDIGRNDNFLDLGGDSLFAIQLSVEILNVFKMELPLDALYDRPTVASLAELIPVSAPEG